MNVRNDELVSVRDFRRESAGLLDRLAKNKREKLVLTRHGEMVAVVVTVEEYERLTEG